MSILWRPNLFSAVGAAFYNDKTNTLEDGNHFRWHINPLIGLPYETHQGPSGGFFILKLNDKYPCLQKLDLQKYAGVYPYIRSLNNKIDSNIVAEDNGFYFIRESHAKSNLAVQQMKSFFQALSFFPQSDSPEFKKYNDYWNNVLEKFQSDYIAYSPQYEKAEVCAVQMTFTKGEGTTPGTSDSSSNPGCLGIFLGLLTEKKYAIVKALDKEGNVVAEDWIGRRAASATNLTNRTKRKVRLTGVGISKIVIEPQPGQPIYERSDVAWVNCEDYCNAPIWDLIVEDGIRFDPREDSYSPAIHKDKYYSPFKKAFNWNQVDQLWKTNVINNPDIIDLFDIANKKSTHDLYYHTTKLAEENTSEIGFSEINIPLLNTLLQGTIDTALASLFGLYRRITTPLQDRDVMIGAIPPFFEPHNLDLLYTKLIELLGGNAALNTPAISKFFINFLHNANSQDLANYNQLGNLRGAINGQGSNASHLLGSLVLCEHLEQLPKEAPKTPLAFNTKVTAVDLPDNETSDEVKLFVDSVINIPRHPFTRNPYETVFYYLVERNIGNTSFENAAAGIIVDPLEDLGILPSIFTPNKEKEVNTDQLRDNFKLDVPPEDKVQYRVKGYDIFCRPTDWVTDAERDIPIPCHPPTAPTNLSSEVKVENGLVIAEVVVSVDRETQPFQAIQDKLEIAIHTLGVNEPGEVDKIQWTGSKIARGVSVTYGGTPYYPDTSTAVINCKSLSWVDGKIVWTDAGTSCDASFPTTPFSFAIFITNTMIEADTNFRTFKLRIGLGEVSTLGSGDHRWCARIRIAGNCDGVTKYSKESCASIRHKIVAPPPPVAQLPVSIIPESTSADKLGASYYSLDVSPYIPSPVAGSPSMVNIYRIDLEALIKYAKTVNVNVGMTSAELNNLNLGTLVKDNLLLAGKLPLLISLAKVSKTQYERINENPVEINSSPEFYRIQVPGALETYHVLGVVGCNPEREENAWENASISLFKTPEPVAVPTLRFNAAQIKEQADGTLAGGIVFKSNFEAEVTGTIPAPKILVFRKDYHTKKSSFVGETSGTWNATESTYNFSIEDTSPEPWRKYAYEANLLIGAEKYGGKFIKSKEKATGSALAPGIPGSIPLDDSFTSSIVSTATGFELTFEFLIGDFNIAITKINDDLETSRATGRINNGMLSGLNNAATLTVLASGNYQIAWNHNDPDAGTYTVRISRGQQLPWSIKLKTP